MGRKIVLRAVFGNSIKILSSASFQVPERLLLLSVTVPFVLNVNVVSHPLWIQWKSHVPLSSAAICSVEMGGLLEAGPALPGGAGVGGGVIGPVACGLVSAGPAARTQRKPL